MSAPRSVRARLAAAVFALVALVLLAGCNPVVVVGQASAPGTPPTRTVHPTVTPLTATQRPGPGAMPAGFRSGMCLFVAILGGFEARGRELSDEIRQVDMDAASTTAYAYGADVMVGQAALDDLPPWPPADGVVSAYRHALDILSDALDKVDRGASSMDADLLGAGSDRLGAATVALDDASAKVVAFRSKTGISCP